MRLFFIDYNEVQKTMVNWYLGSMGFSYSDWNGPFYPHNTSPQNYISYYSRYFNSVELDTTFYGTPRDSTVRRWYAISQDDFQFTAKVPRQVTHEKGLVNTIVEMNEFITTIARLEEKLGAVLIQLSPSYHADNLDHLANFLKILPRDIPFAVEFRDASWFTAEVVDLLRENNVCWASTEFPGYAPPVIYRTTDWLYFRWIGVHGRFDHFDEVQIDVTQNLQIWVERIEKNSDGIEKAFGFFNNDYSGFSPATINDFKTMIGETPVDFQPPQQPKLF